MMSVITIRDNENERKKKKRQKNRQEDRQEEWDDVSYSESVRAK